MTTADPTRALRVVYMGTPDFAVPALQSLLASRHQVVGVVTNPDKPVGRGNKISEPPVKRAALAAGVEVFQPKGLRNEAAQEKLRAWAPDLIVVAAYGRILPEAVLAIAPLGCLNIHASLLPHYRGAAPINWCIVRGEVETGITIMQMEAGLDTGPMLLKRAVAIAPDETAQTLHDKLAPLGGPLLLQAIDSLLDGSISPQAQDHELATWAPMIKREDAALDWTKPAQELDNQLRGFSPWPGASSWWHPSDAASSPQLIKIGAARAVEGEGAPGEVLSVDEGAVLVACGQGALRLDILQAPGRRALPARDFLNGTRVSAGDRFGDEPEHD